MRHAFDLAIDREALNQVVFNGEFVPGNQWVNPQNPYYQQKFPVPKRDLAKAKALLKEAGVTGRSRSTTWSRTRRRRGRSPRWCSRWSAEAGFDLKIRVTEVATALKEGEERRVPALPEYLERPHRP